MWFVFIPLGVLTYLLAIMLDLTIFFLVVRAVKSCTTSELVAALDRIGEPLVDLLSERIQWIARRLWGKRLSERGTYALLLVTCTLCRVLIPTMIVRVR